LAAKDTPTPVKVAALQMTSAADVTVNLAVAARLLAEARAAGARVAVLPENFSFMGLHDVDKRAIAEADGDGPVQQFLSQQARELGLWIVGGTTPIAQQPGGRVAAACLVYGDDGRRDRGEDLARRVGAALSGIEREPRLDLWAAEAVGDQHRG